MCSPIQNQLEKINLKKIYSFILLDFPSQKDGIYKVTYLVIILLAFKPKNTFTLLI